MMAGGILPRQPSNSSIWGIASPSLFIVGKETQRKLLYSWIQVNVDIFSHVCGLQCQNEYRILEMIQYFCGSWLHVGLKVTVFVFFSQRLHAC